VSEQKRGILVRAMEPGDIAAVAALDKACFDSPSSEATYADELARSQARLWVALGPATDAATGDAAKPQLCGYAVAWIVASELQIMTVAAAPGFRRRGVGRALVCRLLTQARDEACSHATLEVRCGNAAALALYERLGFARVGRRPGYYPASNARPGAREDAILMTRALSSAVPDASGLRV